MPSVDESKARAIFDAALDIAPAERFAFIAQACGEDLLLRARVEALLGAVEKAGSFLEDPALEVCDDSDTREAADPRRPDLTGRLIDRYKILQRIGSGGMGVVYLAVRADGRFHKQVAVKVMQPGAGEHAVNRFLRERQILAEIEHPNIARLIDGGEVDGAPYIVMEYVDGRNLREILNERGALPLDQIVDLAKQLAAGLDAAHQRGIIHRDIKPENLIVSERDGASSVKILDFGVARPQQLDTGEVKTQDGAIIGSAKYLSPEQAAGKSGDEIDARTDVYSLGAVIFEMLTGEPVFKGDSYLSLINQHLNAEPRSPDELRAELKRYPNVSKVTLSSLAKRREDRQSSAGQFVAELEKAWTDKTEPSASVKQIHVKPSSARSLRKIMALALAVVLFSLALGLATKFRRDSRTLPSSNPTQSAQSFVSTPAQAQYRVFKKSTDDKVASLLADDIVQTGDQIYFEITLPFSGACYLFYEIRDDPKTPQDDSSLVWANPRPNRPPQKGQAGETLRMPESGWIPFDEPSRKQNFLVVYVPDNISWSLEDIVHSDKLKIETEDAIIPHAEVRSADAKRLLQYLNDHGRQVTFTKKPIDGRYTAQLDAPQALSQVVFHRITIWHGKQD